MDHAFDNLISHTGLGIRGDQGTAWMLLIGSILGILGYFVHEEIWFALVAFAVGALGVLIIFVLYRRAYLTKLEDQLADTIYLMARSLRTGMSLEQAIEMIGERGIQPLASEFKRCDAQIKLGLPVSVALENMAKDLQMIDFNALVSTVAVFQTTGGNLPMLLDRLASQARDRSNMRKHFRTTTALARVSIIPIGLAVPTILVCYYIWQPDYAMAYLQTTGGKMTVICCVLAECVGLLWIYRLLRFDY
jgi:tight adherence protein B